MRLLRTPTRRHGSVSLTAGLIVPLINSPNCAPASEVVSLLNDLISAKTVTTRHRPSEPWFDPECRQMKRDVRRLERSARLLITSEATADWYSKRREYHGLCRRKREQFWREKIDAEKSTPRQLWSSIDALLGRGRAPPPDDIGAEQFHRFFSMTRSLVSGLRQLTPRHRRFRRFLLIFHSASFNQ